MAEYIDREAAIENAISQMRVSKSELCMRERLMNIPAADVRPVVRCCDCKHFQINVSPSGYLPQGVPEWECRYWCRPTDPTDFCSYGEKREES